MPTQDEMEKTQVTQEILNEVISCCHHGHGASIFIDGTVMQGINENDIIARSDGEDGWDYCIAYIDDPEITIEQLQKIFDECYSTL